MATVRQRFVHIQVLKHAGRFPGWRYLTADPSVLFIQRSEFIADAKWWTEDDAQSLIHAVAFAWLDYEFKVVQVPD